MKTLGSLTARHTKLFFKDKGTFLPALMAPLILLLLFITFLGSVYRDSFNSAMPAGVTLPEELLNGFVGGWLISSLLAVCCVTVAFSANMIMAQDKVNGSRGDLTITPLQNSTLGLSYYLSTAIITGIICLIAAGAGFLYLSQIGWYLSGQDVLLVLLDTLLLVLFGTALSSVICFFLSSEGSIAAVTAVVSAAYGFLCGAYMPIASFSPAIQQFITFLPGTYGTVLLHNHLMSGVMDELAANYLPAEAVSGLKDSFDQNLYFFDQQVTISQMYMVLILSIGILVGLYILLNIIKARKTN